MTINKQHVLRLNRVLQLTVKSPIKQLKITQPFTWYLAFYKTRRKPIKSCSYRHNMFKIHVDVSFDKRLDLESGHFPSDFLAEILCSFLISPLGWYIIYSFNSPCEWRVVGEVVGEDLPYCTPKELSVFTQFL